MSSASLSPPFMTGIYSFFVEILNSPREVSLSNSQARHMVKRLRFAIPDSLDEPPQEVGGAVIYLMKGLHLSVPPLFGQFYLSEVVLAFTKEVVTSLIFI